MRRQRRKTFLSVERGAGHDQWDTQSGSESRITFRWVNNNVYVHRIYSVFALKLAKNRQQQRVLSSSTDGKRSEKKSMANENRKMVNCCRKTRSLVATTHSHTVHARNLINDSLRHVYIACFRVYVVFSCLCVQLAPRCVSGVSVD